MTKPTHELGDTRATAPDKSNEERYFITALSRGLEVLACFGSGDKALSNQQIAKRCGLPKSTVTRITFTLTKLGYLIQLESGGEFAIGSATLALGGATLARMDVRQVARPLMQELADLSNGAVALGVRDRLSMIYIEVCRSSAAVALTLQVGSRMPLATSAMGRAFLATASEQERDDILSRWQELDETARASLRHGVEKGIEDYRRFGCATSFGEWQQDVNGIAVGISAGAGTPAMSINCGGPASSLSKDFLLTVIKPRLIALAARLESSAVF